MNGVGAQRKEQGEITCGPWRQGNRFRCSVVAGLDLAIFQLVSWYYTTPFGRMVDFTTFY